MPKTIKKQNKLLISLAIIAISPLALSKGKSYALTPSPPRLEVEGEPGQVLQGELELYNEQDTEATFYLSYQNFEARGETGSPYFLPNTDEGLASWIKTGNSIVIGPRERIKFPFEIHIPQDTEAGGHFAAIFFGTTPATPEEGGQVTIGGKVGTLIFLNIPGDVPEGAGIIEFGTKSGKILPYLPVELYYRFSNDGGRKVMPLGNIEIKCMVGKVVGLLDANAPKGNVLPGSVRRFEVVWDKIGQNDLENNTRGSAESLKEGNIGFFDAVKMQIANFAIGKYTANLSLKYGEDQTTSTKQAVFYIIPWQLLVLVLGGLIILITIIKISSKRHNERLTEKIKKEIMDEQKKTAPKAPKEEKTVEKDTSEEVAPQKDGPQPLNPAQ